MVFLHLSKIVFKKECKNVERVGMIPHIISNQNAKVAELVDALDLGSSIVRCESSSLSFRTIYFFEQSSINYTRE
jgi:hypothetical protein